MPASLLAITHLLLATAFLELGNGLQGVLIPIRAQLEGFSTRSIGLLGTAYYAGFVLGCFIVPSIVRRVGHIRAFSGFASFAAAAFLAHEFIVAAPVWFGLRLIIGFCFAGLAMTIESWLNHRATREIRGRILAAYMTTSWIAIIGGKLIFAWSDPSQFVPFALVSICISLSVVPVTFTTGSAPAPAPRGRLRIKEILAISPVGLIGCLGVGAANGAFWSLAPIYAEARGLSTLHIGLFMAAAVAGGAITQWPLGKWSDRTDRRRVIALSCLAAAGAAAALVWRYGSDETTMLLLSFLFGACALPVYALCVAHTNDQAPANSFVEVSGDLLLMFGVGAIFGPFLAALLMTEVGHTGVFLFTGGVHLGLAAFVVLRIWQHSPVHPSKKAAAFLAVPETTHAILPLDPRSEDRGDNEAEGMMKYRRS